MIFVTPVIVPSVNVVKPEFELQVIVESDVQPETSIEVMLEFDVADKLVKFVNPLKSNAPVLPVEFIIILCKAVNPEKLKLPKDVLDCSCRVIKDVSPVRFTDVREFEKAIIEVKEVLFEKSKLVKLLASALKINKAVLYCKSKDANWFPFTVKVVNEVKKVISISVMLLLLAVIAVQPVHPSELKTEIVTFPVALDKSKVGVLSPDTNWSLIPVAVAFQSNVFPVLVIVKV